MSLSTLPTEILLDIAQYLDNLRDLNALVQAGKRYDHLFRTQLYDLGLRCDSRARGQDDEDKEEDDHRYDIAFTDAVVSSASSWESEFIQNYLLNHVDSVFRCPSPANFMSPHPVPFVHLNILSAMVMVRNLKMVQLILSRDEDKYIYLEHDLPSARHRYNGKPLGIALFMGFEEITDVLLDAGASILTSWHLGALNTPPLCAARSARMAMRLMKEVQAAGGNILEPDRRGAGPLHYAVCHRQPGLIVFLLTIGEDPWRNPPALDFPISQAMAMRDKISTRILLENMLTSTGAKCLPSHHKERLLHVAMSHVDLEIVERLLDVGADIFTHIEGKGAPFQTLYTMREKGDIPTFLRMAALLMREEPYIWPVGHINRELWKVARSGKLCVGLVNFFCEQAMTGGPIPSECDGVGRHDNIGFSTSLSNLCRLKPGLGGIEEDKEVQNTVKQMIALLLDNGASPTERDQDGEIPLLLAAGVNYPCDILGQFQDRIGTERMKSVTTESQCTLLHLAAGAANEANVKLLIDAGFSVFATEQNGDTPLHKVVTSHSPYAMDVARLLLHQGSPINAINASGETVLARALGPKPNPSVVRLLVDAGCDVNITDEPSLDVLNAILAEPRHRKNTSPDHYCGIMAPAAG